MGLSVEVSMPDGLDALDVTGNIVALQQSSVDAYIRHGWSLIAIPPGRKGPITPNWNERDRCLRSNADLPPNWGIGLAHAYSGTMALDIDHWDRAAVELQTIGLDLNALYQAPDAVVIHSGKAGHGKLLYSMPFGLVLPSKRINYTSEEGTRPSLELRCGTVNGQTVQDVLPPSIHPETQKPYRWAGYGHWTRPPVIPLALLDYWQRLIGRDSALSVVTHGAGKTSWDEIRTALTFISPDCDRETWIEIGMALHFVGAQGQRPEDAFAEWDRWSQGTQEQPCAKYPGVRQLRQQWASMRIDKANSVRLGTLFHIAKTKGYERPRPDVSHLFASKPVPSIDDIMAMFEMPRPSMDMRWWPGLLRSRAEEVGQHMGLDPLIPLFAGLGAVCGAIDARTRLELMPGFKVPPVLWLMTIGDPADKKSPGSRPMLAPLKSIEIEDRPHYARELLRWEGRQAAHDTAKKAFLQWSASPESLLGGDAPLVPDLASAPVPLKIVVNDTTSQKLVRSAAERPRGLLASMDEMASWVGKISDKTSGEDRSAWVQSYEADSYLMDRVGAGSIVCDNFAVSIYGNIQPEVFRKALPSLTMDGLIQRFIPAILRPMARKGDPLPEAFTQAKAWESQLRLIYALPAVTYRLTDEAHRLYRAFQDWYENQKTNERMMQSSASFMTAFGKLEGTCGRLALVLHVIESPFNPEVSVDTLQRAIDIVRGYVVPALRYALDANDASTPFFKWAVDWVVCNADLQTVTLGKIKSAAGLKMPMDLGPHQASQFVINAMQRFEDAGWLARIDDGQWEHRHVAEWAINPMLIGQFDGYRKRREEIRRQHREISQPKLATV